MRREHSLIIGLICTAAVALILVMQGCAYVQPIDPADSYQEQFKEWQERQMREGWTAGLVSDVIGGCVDVGAYAWVYGGGDHWQTYAEFIRSGYKGDCEDFAFFAAGTLRRLGYPHRIWLTIYLMPMGGHACLDVELPDGRVKHYNSLGLLADLDMILPPARLVARYEVPR